MNGRLKPLSEFYLQPRSNFSRVWIWSSFVVAGAILAMVIFMSSTYLVQANDQSKAQQIQACINACRSRQASCYSSTAPKDRGPKCNKQFNACSKSCKQQF